MTGQGWSTKIFSFSTVKLYFSGGSTVQQSTKYRLLLTTWLLSLTVLMYSYSGMLTSTMAKQPYEILANSPEDLAQNEKILTYMPEKSPGQEYLKVPMTSVRIAKTFNLLY